MGRQDGICRNDGQGNCRNDETRRLGWEDIQPKIIRQQTDSVLKTESVLLYQPQVPDGTVIERPIIDDTLPGGPVQRNITYVAPFTLANREADYRVAWAFFSREAKV